MRSTRTRALLAGLATATATAGLVLSFAPADAAGMPYSASYNIKNGVKSGTTEAAKNVADIRKVTIQSPKSGGLVITAKIDNVTPRTANINGVYTVGIKLDTGSFQVVSVDMTDEQAGAVLGVSGDGCADWTVAANAETNKVTFRSKDCGAAKFVDAAQAQGAAVTDSGKRVGYDLTKRLERNVRLR